MDTKKLEEFTQMVKAGDITDFEPWFEEPDPETLQTLKQICIRHGIYQDAYMDWALDNRDPWTQQMKTAIQSNYHMSLTTKRVHNCSVKRITTNMKLESISKTMD